MLKTVCWLCVQVAYAWATSLNEDEAAALLRRLNMGEGVVEHAMEIGAFNHAFQLAQLAAKNKLPDVHLKYAMFLEDSGRFVEAEGEFVAAGRHGVGPWWFCPTYDTIIGGHCRRRLQ
jgi:intraflagellar transport protein 172